MIIRVGEIIIIDRGTLRSDIYKTPRKVSAPGRLPYKTNAYGTNRTILSRFASVRDNMSTERLFHRTPRAFHSRGRRISNAILTSRGGNDK